MATVRWEDIEALKEFGGLGFANIQIKNNGLLLKWRWRFLEDEGSLGESGHIH